MGNLWMVDDSEMNCEFFLISTATTPEDVLEFLRSEGRDTSYITVTFIKEVEA